MNNYNPFEDPKYWQHMKKTMDYIVEMTRNAQKAEPTVQELTLSEMVGMPVKIQK